MKLRSAFYTTSLILTLLLIVSVFFFVYNSYVEYNDHLVRIENEGDYYIETVYFKIQEDLKSVFSDLVINADSYDVTIFLLNRGHEEKARIEGTFSRTIGIGKPYDQMRLLDVNGLEVLRVNNTDEGNGAMVVMPDEYQDKSSRYYYTDMIDLKSNEIYLSSFDLNIENGEIEVPYVPTIRIGKKVFYEDQHIGYLLINYNASEIIASLDWSNQRHEYSTYLINDAGNYIYGPNLLNFNFMFPDKVSQGFKDMYPEEWGILDDPTSEVVNASGDFLYRKIDILNEELINGYVLNPKRQDTQEWHIVSLLSSENKNHIFIDVFKENIFVYLLILLMVIIISILLGYLTWRNRSYQKNLKLIAERDALTGEYNRRLGMIMLQENMNRVKRYQETMSVAYIDINSLKYVNDKFGHEFGDRYIRHITETINITKRESDILARIGGDEFILILPNCTKAGAEGLLNRMIEKLEEENEKGIYPYTMSFAFGIVEYSGDESIQLDELLESADSLMYEKKKYQKQYLRY